MFHQFVQGPIAQVFDTLDVPSFVNGDEALVMNGVEWMAGHTWGAHRVQLNGNALGGKEVNPFQDKPCGTPTSITTGKSWKAPTT